MSLIIDELKTILEKAESAGIELILGGGLGLFIKQIYMTELQNSRTLIEREQWPTPRTTTDIDLFLNSELITNATALAKLRAILDELGFETVTPNWQFARHKGTPGEIRIDLLVGRVPEGKEPLLRRRENRVRAKGESVEIQGYSTNEAIDFDKNLLDVPIEVHELRIDQRAVKVPSSFSYLLMKLHATADNMHREKKDMGRHHALDVYRIIAMMSEADFTSCKASMSEHRIDSSCQHAAYIVKEFFTDRNSVANMRLQEHPLYQAEFALEEFISILQELFQNVVPVRNPNVEHRSSIKIQDHKEWQIQCQKTLAERLGDNFEEGPLLQIFFTPIRQKSPINFEKVSSLSTYLMPWGNTGISGERTNFGYQALRAHAHTHGSARLFDDGRIDAVFHIDTIDGALNGNGLDHMIVELLHSYTSLMRALQVAPEYRVTIWLSRLTDVNFKTVADPQTGIAASDHYILEDIEFTDAAQVESQQAIGNHIVTNIDRMWKAFGMRASSSYDQELKWTVPVIRRI